MANFDQETVITEIGKRPMPAAPGNDSLVVIYAKEESLRGKRYKLEKSPLTIGRVPDNDVVLDDDAVSRRHAQVERRGEEWFIVDVGSRNGTLHNEGELAREAALTHGDRIKVGSTIFKYLTGADAESAYFEEVFKLTITDGLTQVNNRRHLDEALEREFLRARRHSRPLSLLVLDIDFFKRINDQYGHLAGDHVLRELASLVQGRVRRDETVARYGGEEFVVLLPETAVDGAVSLAENLRARIEAHSFVFQGVTIPVTVSIGCAEVSAGDGTGPDLFRRADEKLYQAKQGGRNRVCH
ncbi:MAG: diguanylate cyclase [Polyangiaceae bacterium]|nr:diguanylate cyclase [Polyangiaceae bacterium]MCE7894693.1 diguanylate cyclase [Sorangiineae bacterium PRO1]MCL4751400.1 diguanylate cyclase [Myxococcales bacterium]